MKKKICLVWLLIINICLLTSCGKIPAKNENHKPRLFGASYMTRNNPYFNVLNETLEEAIEANGDILISRDPCQQQDKQNEQILEMIDEGIEVLFLNPVDWEKVTPALEACKDAGVVVINIDTQVKRQEYVISYIETDNYLAGALCAQDMMKTVPQAKIVILNNPIQTSISNRVKGFTDAIADNDNYEIIYMESGEGEFEVSAKVTSEILKKGMSFDVIFGGNDPTALGALAALQQHGSEENILIYGIDGSPDFKAMLPLGYVTGTAAQSPKTIAEVASDTAYKYLNGEEIEKYKSIQPYMITRKNLNAIEINSWQ